MAWACMEGFDGLASYSEIGLRSWRSVGAGLKLGTNSGRRGSCGIYDDTAGSTTERAVEYGGNFFRTTPSLVTFGSTADFEFGFAFKLTGSGWASKPSGYTVQLASLRSTSGELMRIELHVSGSTWQIRQIYDAAGVRAFGSFPGISGSGTRPESDRWYYVTFMCSGWEGTGTITKYSYILVDGAQIGYSATATANATASLALTNIRLGSGNGVSTDIASGDAIHWDDVVLCSGIGEEFNSNVTTPLASCTYMGPIRVDKIVGISDNIYHDDAFTASSGSGDPEYAMLDDAYQDGDTTYVESSTPGQMAQGGWSSGVNPLPHTPVTIWGIKANAVVKNAGDGIALVRCRIGRVNNTDSAAAPLTSLAANGAYEGVHSLNTPGVSSSDGDLHGSYDASATGVNRWTNDDVNTSIRSASALLHYVR